MNSDFDYTLLIKFLISKLTPEEMNKLTAWRNFSDRNVHLFDKLTNLKIAHDFKKLNNKETLDQALDLIHKQIPRAKPFKKYLRIAVAAVIALMIGLGGAYYTHQNEGIIYRIAKEGNIKKIQLSDSTIVWLNPLASLVIPEDFNKTNRHINITGKAFLKVKRDASHPFLVHTPSAQIKVTGTSFSVNQSKKSPIVELILVKGKIALQSSKGKPIIQVAPGEKITFDTNNNEVKIDNVDALISTAWHINLKTYESCTLREISNSLSGIYHVSINIVSPKLAQRKFRFILRKDENLIQTLDNLSYLAHIKYEINENEIYIYEPSKALSPMKK